MAYSQCNKFWKVPQNRERIIIISTRDGRFNFSRLASLSWGNRLKLADFLDKEGDFEYLEEPYTLLDKTTSQKSGLIFAGYRHKRIRTVGTRPGTKAFHRVFTNNQIVSILQREYTLHPISRS